MSNNTYIVQLNYASLQINRYVSIGLLLFGAIGNVLSCLVFIQRTLRGNPCVMYFLVASIANLISLVAGIPPRMLSSWNILSDNTETNPAFCKSRLMVLFTSRNIAAWLLVFATIDRYLISSRSANIRRMSNLKQAYHWIIMVCLVSVILWSECLYCFDANLIGTPLKCYAKSDACRIVNDLAQALVTTIIPSIFMLIFGLCTIANIHRIQQVQPATASIAPVSTAGRRKPDHHLTRMLFAQVMLLTIFNIPQAIQKFYLTSTFYQPKPANQKALENLIFAIVLLFTYVPNCMPFYLYILTSHSFRSTFYQLHRKIMHCSG